MTQPGDYWPPGAVTIEVIERPPKRKKGKRKGKRKVKKVPFGFSRALPRKGSKR